MAEAWAVDPASGCWLWQKKVTSKGYGLARLGGREMHAHRWVWTTLRGPIPAGFEMHHVCENRLCVNPDHLEPIEGGWHRSVHHQQRRKESDVPGPRSVTTRLPQELVEWMDEYARERRWTRSTVLHAALDAFREDSGGGVPDMPARTVPKNPVDDRGNRASPSRMPNYAMERQRKLNADKERRQR